MARHAGLSALALLALALVPSAARGQERPVYDATRHVLIVTSPLDSADAAAVLQAALREEGLELQQSDTLRGRLITVRRPSDSFGAGGGTLIYAAMVRRVAGGGCQVILGGIIQQNINTRPNNDPQNFARAGQDPNATRAGGDLLFLRPGSAQEWRRLERIADRVQRAGR